MKDLNQFLFVAERDIDLLLLEELNVNPGFSSWLFAQVLKGADAVPICKGAWHSVSHSQLGESDLVVSYEGGSAILLENKIDAPAQPEQAARYRRRGVAGCDDGLWHRFVTCIVAPERYLKANMEAQNYDLRVSYEQIRDWFREQNSTRSAYRARVVNEAIEQNRRGYSPVADDDVTRFWESYWKLATRKFSLLDMPCPGIKPANSDWPDFRPRELGKRLNIVHKMAQGYVDLQVRGAAERVDEIRSLLNEADLEVVTAGKSAAVRVPVSPIDRFGSFEAQISSVLRALEAAESLYFVAMKLRSSKTASDLF